MTDKDRLHWMFLEFLKMETKYEAAAAELAEIKAPLRFLVDAETKRRVNHRHAFKNNNTFSPSAKGRLNNGRNKRD